MGSQGRFVELRPLLDLDKGDGHLPPNRVDQPDDADGRKTRVIGKPGS